MAKRRPASFALALKQSAEPADLVRDDHPPAPGANSDEDNAVLAEARERWNRCDEAEDAQRKSILLAKKFRAGDQWPDAIKIQRQGSSAIQGQAAQPPRPCLTIDRLSQPARQVSNTIKNADFGFDVLPNGYGADDDTAQFYEGYLRRMQVRAREESPIEWAADGAVEGGLGWLRLRTEYVHETWTGPVAIDAFDQELRMERIVNNLTVYCDPSANKPTRSDALFMFVTEDLAREEFRRRWPKASLNSLEEFAATGDMKGWVSDDSIRIAEYWRVRFEREPITFQGHQRVLVTPKVEMFTISAAQVLERTQWVGSRIPLIPILGEELNIDGKPLLRGIYQEGMDAQRMVNYTYSGAMEIFALGNKSQFIVEEQQISQFQQIWQTANTYNYSYLPYTNVNGVPPPHRETSEAPIEAAVALMRVSEEAIKATTGIYDPTLGAIDPRAHSGRAIEAVKSGSDLTTSHYPDNVTRAMTYAGNLAVEIIPKITRPGQLLQIIGDDDVPEQVLIGQPYILQQGKPVPLPPELQQLQAAGKKFYDLNKGKYSVTVTAGKATATKREEGAAALKDLIPHLPPELAMAILPDFVRQLSFTGSEKIATKLEKALPPQLQEQEEGGPDPRLQAAMQQIQALQQQIQSKQAEKMAEAQAKGAMDMQKTQVQEQAENQRTAAKLQADLTKAELQASTTLGVAQAKVDAENFRSYVDALESKIAHRLDLHMQDVNAAVDRLHEHLQSNKQMAHEVGMAHLEHKHALEQGQQAAALAPPPTNGDGNGS